MVYAKKKHLWYKTTIQGHIKNLTTFLTKKCGSECILHDIHTPLEVSTLSTRAPLTALTLKIIWTIVD